MNHQPSTINQFPTIAASRGDSSNGTDRTRVNRKPGAAASTAASRPDSFKDDPEYEYARSQGEGENPLWLGIGWLLLFIAGCWVVADAACHRAGRWFRWKRVCSWCVPPRRVGGNPFASNITHTCCPDCQVEFLRARRQSKSLRSSAPLFGVEAGSERISSSTINHQPSINS